MNENRTIVALSTPVGVGAISIVRLSGYRSIEYLGRLFKPYGEQLPNMLTLGVITADGVRDKVMAVVFRAPKSYTGEDMAEVHCHGSPEIVRRIIRAFISLGAEPAEPGEFTRRAFLSGKLSLDEAEAVSDLISARSAGQINSAFEAMQGSLYGELSGVYEEILSVVGGLEAAIDYPEEDVEEMASEEARAVLTRALDRLKRLASTFDEGERVRNGVKVALVGAPNAGKSSLLNRLLGRDRAIVTANAGTTRDTIEESYEYGGALFNLVDTAGVRETDDEAEKEGVARSERAAKSAHIVLRITDLTNPVHVDVKTDGKIIEVYNKVDVCAPVSGGVNISAQSGEGVDELKKIILETASVTPVDGAVITNARHYSLVLGAVDELSLALADIGVTSVDCLLVGLRNALAFLGGVTGVSATDDVINEIFSKFCVGK